MFKNPRWAALIDPDMARGMASALSFARLGSYRVSAEHCEETARARGEAVEDWVGPVARHGVNIVLCEALYPTLHMIEVALRNRLHNTFSHHFDASDWFEQAWIGQGHALMVAQAKDDLMHRGRQPTVDRIVAELNFGFWCGMFHSRYEADGQPWPKLLRTVFPRLPESWATRDKVRSRVEAVRWLRNRVFHHEPILQLQDIRARHRAMIELLGWLCPEARAHVATLCRFNAVHEDRLCTNELSYAPA
jgi:uncharacterized protein YfiM (DUF2279 family)